MERDFWQIALDRTSEKRPSPFASDYGTDSSDGFASESRAHKQPKLLRDQIDGFPADFEHDIAYSDVFESSPTLDSFPPEALDSDISSIHENNGGRSPLKQDLSVRILQDMGNPICSFGMVCEHCIDTCCKI